MSEERVNLINTENQGKKNKIKELKKLIKEQKKDIEKSCKFSENYENEIAEKELYIKSMKKKYECTNIDLTKLKMELSESKSKLKIIDKELLNYNKILCEIKEKEKRYKKIPEQSECRSYNEKIKQYSLEKPKDTVTDELEVSIKMKKMKIKKKIEKKELDYDSVSDEIENMKANILLLSDKLKNINMNIERAIMEQYTKRNLLTVYDSGIRKNKFHLENGRKLLMELTLSDENILSESNESDESDESDEFW